MKIGFGPALASKLTSQVAMISIFATATVGAVSLISSSVFASLDATATYSPQSINNGTLLLNQSASTSPASAGFTSSISLLAPQDIVHRYVDVVNSGTIAGSGLSLKATVAGPTTLDSDITVTAETCSVPWVIAGNSSTCADVSPVPGVSGTLASFATAQPLGVSLAASATSYVKITTALSNIIETSNNGVLNPLTTHEGKTTSVTWQFAEAQRASTETNS